jgi:hypothetical protein
MLFLGQNGGAVENGARRSEPLSSPERSAQKRAAPNEREGPRTEGNAGKRRVARSCTQDCVRCDRSERTL